MNLHGACLQDLIRKHKEQTNKEARFPIAGMKGTPAPLSALELLILEQLWSRELLRPYKGSTRALRHICPFTFEQMTQCAPYQQEC